MSIVLILLLVLLFCGSGYGFMGGNPAFGPQYGGGLGVILLIILVVVLLRGF